MREQIVEHFDVVQTRSLIIIPRDAEGETSGSPS